MAAVTRKGDKCTGHGPYPPRPNNEGSPDVFVNNKPAHRKGDTWETHGHTASPPDELAEGATTVFVNGQPLGRIGDPVTCGSAVAQGSPNVFCSDKPVSVQIEGGVFVYTDAFAYSYRAARPLVKAAGPHAPFDEPADFEIKQRALETERFPEEEPAPEPEEEVNPEDEPVNEIQDGCPVVEDPNDPYNIAIGNAGLTVRDLTLNAIFAHPLRAQNGFSIEEMVCNLHHLALNCLDPILGAFPGLNINSGFRRGTSGSQHNRGMAVDLQKPGAGKEFYKEVLAFIAENCPYDQCILETANGGQSWWVHISFDRNKTAQRKERLTYIAGRSPAYTAGWAV